MISKKILTALIKIFVSVGFITWLIVTVDWKGVLQSASHISIGAIVGYVAVLLIGIAISSYKWKLLAKAKGFHNSFSRYFLLYLSGAFVNNFMPSFIGGDTYRAYAIGKKEKKYAESAAVVVADRITGLLAAMILTVFFSAMNYQRVLENKILLLLVAAIAAALVVFFLLLWTRHYRIWKLVFRFVPRKIVSFLNQFEDLHGNRTVFGKAMLVSIIFSLVGLAGVNYVLFAALGIQIHAIDYLSVIFLISIISSAPVSINNIGVKEWAYIMFFGMFGVNATVVATIAIMSRFLQMGVSCIALPYYLQNKKE